MVEIVYLPKWGMTMTEALIIEWLKSEGDSVEEGEDLVEVETDKVSNTIQAPRSGILTTISAQEDDTVEVGDEIARITVKNES